MDSLQWLGKFLYADGLFYHSQSTDDSLTGFKPIPHTSTVLLINQEDHETGRLAALPCVCVCGGSSGKSTFVLILSNTWCGGWGKTIISKDKENQRRHQAAVLLPLKRSYMNVTVHVAVKIAVGFLGSVWVTITVTVSNSTYMYL